MNRIFLILLIAVLDTPLYAKTYQHDFGTIQEDGGIVSHDFLLDAAAKPYAIVFAVPGCPCIKVSYPKTAVKSGERMTVKLKYDPKDQNRHFTKSVYLKRSDGLKDTIRVTGTVKRTRPDFDKKKYAYDFGMGLRLTHDGIFVGNIQRGKSKTVTVKLINSYQAGMKLDLRPEGRDAAMVSVPYGLMLQPLKEAVIKVEITVPAHAPKGPISATLQPTINGAEVDPIRIVGVLQ